MIRSRRANLNQQNIIRWFLQNHKGLNVKQIRMKPSNRPLRVTRMKRKPNTLNYEELIRNRATFGSKRKSRAYSENPMRIARMKRKPRPQGLRAARMKRQPATLNYGEITLPVKSDEKGIERESNEILRGFLGNTLI